MIHWNGFLTNHHHCTLCLEVNQRQAQSSEPCHKTLQDVERWKGGRNMRTRYIHAWNVYRQNTCKLGRIESVLSVRVEAEIYHQSHSTVSCP